jgi:hypothetical protein
MGAAILEIYSLQNKRSVVSFCFYRWRHLRRNFYRESQKNALNKIVHCINTINRLKGCSKHIFINLARTWRQIYFGCKSTGLNKGDNAKIDLKAWRRHGPWC